MPAPKPTLKQYKEAKIKLLADFLIHLTKSETDFLYALPDEISVDRFAHKLIDRQLSK